MTICPACKTQYSDDTLSFCLQDGTPLAIAVGAEPPTVVMDEVETAEARRGSGSRTALAVILTAIGMLILFSAAGLAAWLYFRDSSTAVVSNTPANANIEPSPYSSVQVKPSTTPPVSTPASNVVQTPAAPVNEAEIRSEVSQLIDEWRSRTVSRDLVALRDLYADNLSYYYTKGNVSASSVIADKQRALQKYNSIQISISDLRVTPDATGESATAVYDKDWSFDGVKPFCGVVRSQMQVKKIRGEWFITGEKDIPGTFKRTC